MNKSVLVTGVPGSGKTAICEELKKMGYKAYNIEDMSGFFKIVNKKTIQEL
jgi:broad-specificity NMP kinase